jgi:hypothetical protein
VRISGSGFVAGATVDFGTREATGVIVNSSSSITATSPRGLGKVDVTVATSGGSSAPRLEFDHYKFVFVPPNFLGGLDIAGYCSALGYNGLGGKGTPWALKRGAVEGTNFAFENWACVGAAGQEVLVAPTGAAPSMGDACRVQHPGKASFAYASDPDSAYTWACYEAPPEEPAPKKATVAAVTPPASGPPAPVLAVSGNIAPVSGHVLVRLPGAKGFVPLSSLRQIPFGAVIEATHGRVVVTTAGLHGGTQTGEFFQGEFVLSQGRNGLVVAALTGGSYAVCPTSRQRAHRARVSARRATGRHVVRKLWANAHGSFSTKGNYAAGAVQGTEWVTEDLCEGTVIRVTRDKVAVTNLVNHRRASVKAGHQYLAKAP